MTNKQITKGIEIMKILAILFAVVIIAIACNGQTNSVSNYEVGIINPVQGKTYIYFKEIKTDTNSVSQLQENMDYLSPNVSSLIQTLTNFRTIGDTLFGDFSVNDTDFKRFLKSGLVQKDNVNGKYSAMATTYWEAMEQLETKPAFFVRKKQ